MASFSAHGVEDSTEGFRNRTAEAASLAVLAGGAAADGLRYVARQPILTAAGEVHGYELLFRSGPVAAFSGDGNAATRAVLDNTLLFGLEKLAGGMPVFVNCTRESLLDGLVMVMPPGQTVLEILETLEPTEELLAACRTLKAEGFRLALDDFAWAPEWAPFVAIADYVKVDLSVTTAADRAALIGSVKSLGSEAALVAERVETRADLEMAANEGFTLFQGYHFCKPVLIENRTIPANALVYLELLTALHEEPMDVKRVSNLVKRDASLTYRLLRMVNSPIYATRKVVTSIQGAVVMIGDEMFRRVATLAIASALKGNHPMELLRMAFLRGRFCELAAPLVGGDPTEQYLVGILSLFPAMLSVSMESIAHALPLRSEVRQALLGDYNKERAILEWLVCYEHADWECCDEASLVAGVTKTKLPKIYAEALEWAEGNVGLVE
jgi:c-di-GMP-related signal transduction protein